LEWCGIHGDLPPKVRTASESTAGEIYSIKNSNWFEVRVTDFGYEILGILIFGEYKLNRIEP
jgi:hypothetical protein